LKWKCRHGGGRSRSGLGRRGGFGSFRASRWCGAATELLDNPVGDQQLERRGWAYVESRIGEHHFAKMQNLAVLLKGRLLDLDESRAHHGIEQRVELVPAHSTDQLKFALQRSCCHVIYRPQFVHDRLNNDSLGGRGVPKPAQLRPCWIADVADSAGTTGIFHISKMPHQLRHAACTRIGESDDILELFGAVL